MKILSLAHMTIFGLFIVLMLSIFQWYTILMEFTTHDFKSGATVESYQDVVEQGGSFVFVRKVINEPQGCRVVVKRYLLPVTAIDQPVFIGQFERRSLPVGELIKQPFKIPAGIPTGEYLYQATADYYCGWLNDLIGPIKVRTVPVYMKVVPKKVELKST